MTYHIIGCGTVGSNLARKLVETKDIQSIHIYDFDSYNRRNDELGMAEYLDEHSDHLKTNVLKSLLTVINPDLDVHEHYEQIIVGIDLEPDDVVVDCRDKKEPVVNSHVQISLDGNILVLDPTGIQRFAVEKYTLGNRLKYIDEAMKIILNYLGNQEYLNNQTRWLVTLEDQKIRKLEERVGCSK